MTEYREKRIRNHAPRTSGSKCIKNISTGKITRVKNHIADNMVHDVKSHVYVSKSEWKEQR